MPAIGEIKREAFGIRHRTSIWSACGICGECRWVQLIKGKAKNLLCLKCSHSGKRHARWAGGRNDNGKGYIRIWLDSDDFFYPMTDLHGYVLEHRLVMAKHLGRCLHQWEVVHHKNHIKTDNSIDNLQLYSDSRHNQLTIMEVKINTLKRQISRLEKENRRLKDAK